MAQSRVEAYNGGSAPGITRFPLSKPVFLREGVAGLVNLLSSARDEQAEQAFAQILAKYLGEAKWEARYQESFEAADGAKRMLVMLANKPKLIAEFNRRGCDWVDWNRAKPLNALSGKAIVIIAAGTSCTRVWPLAASWLSASLENCKQAPPSKELMKKLLKHLDSRQHLDSKDAAMRMAFSLACIESAAYLQQEQSRQSSRSLWRPASSHWKPTTGALLLSGLFVSNEQLADRAIQSGAVPELVRLVMAWYSCRTWTPQSAVPTELQSALKGLINAFSKASQKMKAAAVKQFAECNGHDLVATLLVKRQPQPLQLQAATVLQGGCSVAEIRAHIPAACIEEMAREAAFSAFTDFLGVPRMTSFPAPAVNGVVSGPPSPCTARSMHSTQSTHSAPTSKPQSLSNGSAAAATAGMSHTLEWTERLHEAGVLHGDAQAKAGRGDARLLSPHPHPREHRQERHIVPLRPDHSQGSSSTLRTQSRDSRHLRGPERMEQAERARQQANGSHHCTEASTAALPLAGHNGATSFRSSSLPAPPIAQCSLLAAAVERRNLPKRHNSAAASHAKTTMGSLADQPTFPQTPGAFTDDFRSAVERVLTPASTSSSRLYESPQKFGTPYGSTTGFESQPPSVSPPASSGTRNLDKSPLQGGSRQNSAADYGSQQTPSVPSPPLGSTGRLHVVPLKVGSAHSCGPETPPRPEGHRLVPAQSDGDGVIQPDMEWQRASETASECDGSSTTVTSASAIPLPRTLSHAARGSQGLRINPFKLLPEDIGEDVRAYTTDLPIPHEAEDAAMLLLDIFREDDSATSTGAGGGGGCRGSGDAVPAAAVACGALPQLERLATGSLSHDRNVVELWQLCRVAHHADAPVPLEHAGAAYDCVCKLRDGSRHRKYAHKLLKLSKDHPGIPGFLVRTELVTKCEGVADSSKYFKQLLHLCRVAAAMVDEDYFNRTSG